MRPAALVWMGMVAACVMAVASPAEACSCGWPPTLEARDRAVAVFEGTVVDQRITLFTGSNVLAPEQDIVVGRVWKGDVPKRVSVLYLSRGMCESAAPAGMKVLFFFVDYQEPGRLHYGGCMPNQPIADAADAIAVLGPTLATFDDDPAAMWSGAAGLPLWRQLSTYAATAASYYLNASNHRLHRLNYRPPVNVGPGLMLSVAFVLGVCLITLASGQLRRFSMAMIFTAVITGGCLLVWIGHDIASRPEIVGVLFYR